MIKSDFNSLADSPSVTLDSDEQKIVERIYTAVMEQRLAPQTRLTESTLCECFNAGRMHVRRALLLLSSQGIVDLQSNRGAIVACPNAHEANDVFGARMAIEPSIIRLISTRAKASDLAGLREHIALEDAARSNKERTEIIRLSGEFHVKLAQLAKNAILTRILRELVVRSSLIVGLFGIDDRPGCRDDEHLNMVKSIERRDANEAEDLIKAHLLHIQDGLDLSMPKPSQPDLVKILGAG